MQEDYEIIVKHNHRIDSVRDLAKEVCSHISMLNFKFKIEDTSEFNPLYALEVRICNGESLKNFSPYLPYQRRSLNNELTSLIKGN